VSIKTLPSRVQMAKPRVATIQPGSWRADKQSSTQRGYGYRWQQARLGYLQAHPLCVMCQAEGRVEAATVVDHKVPHRGDMASFWDRDNWQSLCSTHHSADKQRQEAQTP
jgi:5-methylcytosine-specific restriction enzyme A